MASPKTDDSHQTEVAPSAGVPETLHAPAQQNTAAAPQTLMMMNFGVTLTILMGNIAHLYIDADPDFATLVETVMLVLGSTTITELVVFDKEDAFTTHILDTARTWLQCEGRHGSNGSTSVQKLAVCRDHMQHDLDFIEAVPDAFPYLDKLQINTGTLDERQCRALLELNTNLHFVVPPRRPRQRHVAAHVLVGPRTNFAGQQLSPAVELVGVEGFYSDELHSDDGG